MITNLHWTSVVVTRLKFLLKMTENDDWGKTPTSVLFGRLILGVEYLINRRASVQFGKLLLFIYLVLAYIYIL